MYSNCTKGCCLLQLLLLRLIEVGLAASKDDDGSKKRPKDKYALSF